MAGASYALKITTAPHRNCAVIFFVRLYRNFAAILMSGKNFCARKREICKQAVRKAARRSLCGVV
ncbi:hypothetical protein DSECCO2_168010 [anaerobic digester metagenome]